MSGSSPPDLAKPGVTVVVVTDPMCRWCWGMAAATEAARQRLAGKVEFQLLLGGVNLHASRRIGDYGRRHLYHVWREVAATTGQPFAYNMPADAIYNSRLPAMAVRAYARHNGSQGFGMLHRLQEAFFADSLNINDPDVLAEQADAMGWSGGELRQALTDPTLAEIVQWEFENSRQYGTSALPNLLVETQGQRRLLAGGYVDCNMLEMLLQPFLGPVH